MGVVSSDLIYLLRTRVAYETETTYGREGEKHRETHARDTKRDD